MQKILVLFILLAGRLAAQEPATAPTGRRQVVGYITQWDAWKAGNAGVPGAGALTHLNIDYSQYTRLNFSFFGVAVDGSLHSGDLRNQQIHQPGTVQKPAALLFTDLYSSWDLHILFGETEPVYYINAAMVKRAQAQGFEVKEGGNQWSNPAWGLGGALPLPLHKEGGAPGLLELAHQHQVKVLASIGGWSMCRHFPEMAADPVKRKRFVDDCARLIRIGFDGIDLDWEYPGPWPGMNFTGSQADYGNFLILMQELRTALGKDKLISAAFSGDPERLQGFDWQALDTVMDAFNFMTYDYNGGWSAVAGHNSPLADYPGSEKPGWNYEALLKSLRQRKVNLAKAHLGIPFYGRGVIVEPPARVGAKTIATQHYIQPDGQITTAADYTNWGKGIFDGTPTYEFIRQTALQAGSGWTRGWDDQAQVPFLTKKNFFLSYEDAESVGRKAEFIKKNRLGGAIVWTVFGDLQFAGQPVSHGAKLKRWPDVKSPLVHKINEVFAQGN